MSSPIVKSIGKHLVAMIKQIFYKRFKIRNQFCNPYAIDFLCLYREAKIETLYLFEPVQSFTQCKYRRTHSQSPICSFYFIPRHGKLHLSFHFISRPYIYHTMQKGITKSNEKNKINKHRFLIAVCPVVLT